MHSIKIRFVIAPENTLFTGMCDSSQACVCTVQPGTSTGWDSEGVIIPLWEIYLACLNDQVGHTVVPSPTLHAVL